MESDVLLGVSTDRLERFLAESEGEIASIRAVQMQVIAELEERNIPAVDGCRSTREWVASRMDVAPETAAALVSTGRRLVDKPNVAAALACGEVTFDRAVAVARSGEDALGLEFDVAGLCRRVQRQRPLTSREESGLVAADYVVIQPTLHGDAGRIHGSLSGVRFRTVEKALDDRGDQYRMLPDGVVLARRVRNAHALVAMAQDSLDRGDGTGEEGTGGAGSQVTVFVDAATTQAAVAQVEYGPRVGPAALEAILCTGTVQIIGLEQGRPVVASAATRAIPPAIRRFVAHRDDGCCADGCVSRYRLQPHHITPRSRGGTNHPDNLRALCWFHHHVVVHSYGYTIDPEPHPPHPIPPTPQPTRTTLTNRPRTTNHDVPNFRTPSLQSLRCPPRLRFALRLRSSILGRSCVSAWR